ncbi:nuclear transport factor 2 family protein [Sphingobacterium sp. HJSM2_6]|uniref:nuclear transport factor 2 family protein n=1 Tax=Sphingobacterium sp. HJSM2_6 TaxID=3366264 RepID=UPI003BE9E672
MRKIFVGISLLVSIVFSAYTHPSSFKEQRKTDSLALSKKEKVAALLKSLETGDQQAISYLNEHKYIQHNLAVGDGLEGFKTLLQQIPPNSGAVNTVRIFQDADYVFAHTEYNFSNPQIAFDIFRFEDGKIVEHWDNIQDEPATANPSGHGMIDGTIVVKDLNSTEENKKYVRKFVEDVLVKTRMDKLDSYFKRNDYIQHNPQIGDKVSGLRTALVKSAENGLTIKYENIHRVLGEGNFVLVISEGYIGKDHTSFYDLFRVEDGKIAEHWDVLEKIPAKESWKNENGKF